ncbi:MAG: YkvA family protein, partial [Limisphaerales bacterium]
PWYAKALVAAVVAYAFSPIDLIPDPIPVLGHLDDFVLIPLGVLAVRAMIPAAVLAECRDKATTLDKKPRNWVAAVIIITIWVIVAAVFILWAIRLASN